MSHDHEKRTRTAKTGQPSHFHSLIKNSAVCILYIIQLFCKHTEHALINQDTHSGMVFLCSHMAWYGSGFFISNSYSTGDINNNNTTTNNDNIFIKTNMGAQHIYRLAELCCSRIHELSKNFG